MKKKNKFKCDWLVCPLYYFLLPLYIYGRVSHRHFVVHQVAFKTVQSDIRCSLSLAPPQKRLRYSCPSLALVFRTSYDVTRKLTEAAPRNDECAVLFHGHFRRHQAKQLAVRPKLGTLEHHTLYVVNKKPLGIERDSHHYC